MVDLDRINIHAEVYEAWSEKCRQTLEAFVEKGKGAFLRPEEIPDEQARLEDDGSLTIFVLLPNGQEVSMGVPPDQWEWRNPKN